MIDFNDGTPHNAINRKMPAANKRKCRSLIKNITMLACAAFLIACNCRMASAQQPNILVIVLDDARYDMFQPNGGPAFFNTPSINRIAEEGVNFRFMGATSSVCVPSRASMYTGLYAHHHGAFDNGTSPKPGLTYVSSILRDAGYYTGFIGKWLLGKKLPDTPQGFDYWAITDDDEHLDPPIHFNDSSTINYTGHDAVIYTNLAIDFLDNKVPQGEPWLLCLFHRVPHLPYEPISTEDSLYQFAAVDVPENFQPYHGDFPSYLYPGHQFEGDSATLVQSIRDYYETCHAAEYSVNRLLAHLDSIHVLDSTLIIFSSDNGYMMGEHDLEKKTLSYDESLRLPLFIRYPAWFAAGSVVTDEFAANIDFAPTMLEAAGIPDTFNMDGVSLHQLAEGQVHRKDFFLENYTDNGNNWEAIRSMDYLYIYSYCSSLTEEFFDLTADPEENHNLIMNPSYANLIQQYRMKRDSIRLATNDTIYPSLQNCSLESEFYLDADSDGFGNPQTFIRSAAATNGYVANNIDCNDDPLSEGALFHPGAAERANGLDDDCDGLTDETSVFYVDADLDGFGTTMATVVAIEAPYGFSADSTDCNDDPYAGGAGVFPGAPEMPNFADDNCNGLIDEVFVYQDADHDGYGNPFAVANAQDSLMGYVADNTDCNDSFQAGGATIHPGATDLCNGIDDDCNGLVDDYKIVATISPAGAVSVCNSTEVVFVANTGTGISYQWLKNGAAINGATGSSYATTKHGDYQVTESNSFSCLSTSPKTTMSTMNKPAATITPLSSLDICGTGSVKLQANSGSDLSYQWKKGSTLISGATKKTYTATATGTYKVIVTKSNGCEKISDGVKVTNSCKEILEGATSRDETFLLYPNPAGQLVTVYFSLDDAMLNCDAIISVKDMTGREIFRKEERLINGVLRTELEPWNNAANGMYLVTVSIQDNAFNGKSREWMKPVVYQH